MGSHTVIEWTTARALGYGVRALIAEPDQLAVWGQDFDITHIFRNVEATDLVDKTVMLAWCLSPITQGLYAVEVSQFGAGLLKPKRTNNYISSVLHQIRAMTDGAMAASYIILPSSSDSQRILPTIWFEDEVSAISTKLWLDTQRC